MVELDQFKYTLSTYDETLKEVKDSLDLENKERRITELDKSMEEPGFWDDPERSTKTVREAKNLKDTVDGYKHLEQQYEDIQVMIEMGYEENDPAMIPEIQEMLDEFVKELEELRTKTLLSGEYDGCNAILKLNAGAGGTEAMDWCSMLYRMYQRWADKKGFTTEVLDFLDGDEAGLKSITLQVNGENAYGYLKSEKGVHRLVRISPFNAAGKRQTSFVSCDVMPDIEEDLDVEINPDDLRIDTYRSSGAGGQHINKTSSAIRITKLSDIRGDVKDINFGNQIRSYVMQPYTLVKDHRTNAENGNVNAVMDGDIDLFISAYLKWISLKNQKTEEA